MTDSGDSSNYLGHVAQAAEKIVEFTAGMDYADFAADDKTVYAVIRAVEIMEEATKRTSSDVLARYPGIPWTDIVGMRNIVIHNYNDVNLSTVWDTVVDDVPLLLATLGSNPS